MAKKTPVLTQEPDALDLAWRMGDAVLLQFQVKNANWTGTYEADVRKTATVEPPLATMTVTAVLVNGDTSNSDTLFTLTLSKANSRTLGKGTFVWDLEDTGIGLTRLAGKVFVSQDVSRA